MRGEKDKVELQESWRRTQREGSTCRVRPKKKKADVLRSEANRGGMCVVSRKKTRR